MPTILDISEPVGPFEFALRMRGVVVPILSPYEHPMRNDLKSASGLLGVAARLWLRVMGQSPEGMLRAKVKLAVHEDYHSLVDELSAVELVHAFTYIDQVMGQWRNSIMLKAAEALAPKHADDDTAQPRTATPHRHAGSSPAGLTPVVPGATWNGHKVGRARTAEDGTVTF